MVRDADVPSVLYAAAAPVARSDGCGGHAAPGGSGKVRQLAPICPGACGAHAPARIRGGVTRIRGIGAVV